MPSLLHLFKEWKLKCPSSDLVFVDEVAQPLSKKFTYRAMKATCERAGVRLLNPHNLRHTFASQCLIAGVAPLKVSHMLGHADVAVTLKIYSHWCCQEESNAEMQLAERIFGAIPKS